MSKTLEKIQKIHNVLNNAISSINQAKALLKELEQESGAVPPRQIEGTFGIFIGDTMRLEDGSKVEVPANYASKSVLVYGDKLKMYDEGGEKKFKQVERVKRLRIEGVLAKKEGRWHVITSDGAYRVLEAAVEHFKLSEGSVATVLLPLDNKFAPFAAIEGAPSAQAVEEPTREASPAPAPVAELVEVRGVPEPSEPPKAVPVARPVEKPKPKHKPKRKGSREEGPRVSPNPIQVAPAQPVAPPTPLTDEDLR